MRCHYEVLQVEKNADDTTIKVAYKKLALRWHPDKNLDDPDTAKQEFQLVQQAYEVLSDKQERAWYDRHRDQILRGANSEYTDNNLDVFQYFTTSCFKGYGDDENGFYTVYKKVFENIAKEDLDYYENKEEFCEIPLFGTSASDYDSVVQPFYAYWMSYSTKKTYVWLDPFDIRDVRNRRLLKAVEKENKKVRFKAKKERNEEVRNLVAYVRKRDKRVQAWNKQNEAKIESNRKKQEQIQRQKLKEQRQLNESAVQAEWTKFENMTSELQEIEKNLTQEFGKSDSSDIGESDLYCAACNKLFKTEKSFQNHESSRKHRENVELLKTKLLEDDEEYEQVYKESQLMKECSCEEEQSDKGESEESLSERRFDVENCVDCSSSGEENDIVNIRRKKAKKNKVLVQNNCISPDSDSEIQTQTVNRKPQKMKKKNILKVESSDDEQKLSTLPASTSSDDDFSTTKKVRRKNKKSKTKKIQLTNTSSPVVEETNKVTVNEINNSHNGIDHTNDGILHTCSTCNLNFSSKNKLFQHLKKEGHSAYQPSCSTVKVKGKASKKK